MRGIKLVKSKDGIILVSKDNEFKINKEDISSLYHDLGQYLLLLEALK